MSTNLDWDGQVLGDGDLALLVLTDATPAATPVLAAAATDGTSCVVRPDRLTTFLKAHASCRVICSDAAAAHWALDGHLRRAADAPALAALWDFSRTSRLVDITLLDQLVRLAEDGNRRPPRFSLPELAVGCCGVALGETWDRVRFAAPVAPFDLPEQMLIGAVHVANVTLRVGHVLRRSADLVAERLNISNETVARFGPLGLGLQVQGAIAVHLARHAGLRLDSEERAAFVQACDTAVEANLRAFCAEKAAQACVKRQRGQVKSNKDGSPYMDPEKLRDWLVRELAAMRAQHGLYLDTPRDEQGRVSIDPADWDFLARCRRHLRVWADLTAACRVRAALRRDALPELHPRYEVLPGFRSADPDLEQLPRLRPGGSFRPAEGHGLLVVRLNDLDLRALAVVHERRGPSRLAELIRAGQDPVTHLAASLHGSGTSDFAALGTVAPDWHRRWLELSRGLLLAVPAGLGPENAHHYIERDVGIEVSPAELARLYERTVQEVFPELARHLEDDSTAVAAANLGCDRTTLFQHIATDHGFDLVHDDTREAALRKIIHGDTTTTGEKYGFFVRTTWSGLQHLNRNADLGEALQRHEGSPELYRKVFGRAVVSVAGRVRGRMLFSEARRAEFLDLADDALKAALYALVAGGFRLAGVAGHEVALGVPDDSERGNVADRAAHLASGAAEGVLQGMPVPCTSRWAERW